MSAGNAATAAAAAAGIRRTTMRTKRRRRRTLRGLGVAMLLGGLAVIAALLGSARVVRLPLPSPPSSEATTIPRTSTAQAPPPPSPPFLPPETSATHVTNFGAPRSSTAPPGVSARHDEEPPAVAAAAAEAEEEEEEEDTKEEEDPDAGCIFRNSTLYRKIYVYPDPGTAEYRGSILSDAAREAAATKHSSASSRPLPSWPWIEYDTWARHNRVGPYDLDSEFVQYSTELLVREVMTHPQSCLRTYDPETALLFYVPYMPSLETAALGRNYSVQSPYGRALLDVIAHQNYTGWESPHLFGFTSKYWRRRNGSDHLLVYSEPLHGLYHIKRKRGSYHYVHTQQQLQPPIAISIEQSRTFVTMHPRCSQKNVLLPYPNTDGKWFNGEYERQTLELIRTGGAANVSLPLAKFGRRPATMFYKAGHRGFCREMRRALQQDYESCSPSFKKWHSNVTRSYRHGMRLSTFCPAPVGDSPSAKRMYDCLHAGSVPVILSNDFVWPFTSDMEDGAEPGAVVRDGPSPYSSSSISSETFSIRYDAGEFFRPARDPATCRLLDASRPSLEDRLDSVSAEQIQKLQQAGARMSDLYSWYRRRPDLPDHPLLEKVLPDGGVAFKLVKLLEERSDGTMWESCQEELQHDARTKPRPVDPKHFLC